MMLGFIGETPSRNSRGAGAPFQTGRWGDEPYSVLSGGLNFCKVDKTNSLIKSMTNQCCAAARTTIVERTNQLGETR